MWNEPSLKGKRVLVTAGADGIGFAIARGFRDAGARVLVCDVRPPTLEELAVHAPDIVGVRADVSSEADVAALFERVDAQLGGLDVLVNNAGIAGPTGGVETLSLADWERTLAVNITGQFLCARLAVPRLRKGNGPSIVNLSSAAGHLGMPGRSAYSASKWAVIGFTKSLAIELGADGIRVNAILPGAVDGPRIRAVIAAKAQALGVPVETVTRNYTSQAALGRMVTARDVVNMALFAASDSAACVTGQELVVDGHTQALT
jgi:NAD(P)-dependent dehydrogenase (short-subunit alcohol dehydrogenase family)